MFAGKRVYFSPSKISAKVDFIAVKITQFFCEHQGLILGHYMNILQKNCVNIFYIRAQGVLQTYPPVNSLYTSV